MRADQDIRRDLERQLEWEPSIDAREIGVSVKDGVATLSGFVHSFLEKLDAERAAKRVVGVVGLANESRSGRVISVPTAKSLRQLSKR